VGVSTEIGFLHTRGWPKAWCPGISGGGASSSCLGFPSASNDLGRGCVGVGFDQRRLLRRSIYPAPRIATRPLIPPMAPPTIAPVWLGLGAGLCVEVELAMVIEVDSGVAVEG
jgi:hypothetical protein